MPVDIEAATVSDLNRPEWSAAEILDTPLSDELVLRAVVCRVATSKWQWSISSLDGDRGELISAGVARSAIAARTMATCEIAKCLESALD